MTKLQIKNNSRLIPQEFTKLDEEYGIDELNYNFNGIKISRLKVLRNAYLLGENELLNCLLYNSHLNEEEMNYLKTELEAFSRKLNG